MEDYAITINASFVFNAKDDKVQVGINVNDSDGLKYSKEISGDSVDNVIADLDKDIRNAVYQNLIQKQEEEASSVAPTYDYDELVARIEKLEKENKELKKKQNSEARKDRVNFIDAFFAPFGIDYRI